ncbi:(S)-ureidoglycine aminohydrolase [Inediibacterium massiliense]|uniref:(S)-ureidoglycine aminohydrolase n=1 Tax=Inediibacterium massiliense TaxID=1658111 RepID=UPI0006B66DB8|nr:(S)-ureidoglycine aminohydrolase [Inediibacterium massiliense]
MGFRNNNMGYRQDLLSSRAVIKKGNFALIPKDGLVKNTIPGFENCDITILASPKLGATFVDYFVSMLQGGKTTTGFGEDGVETFVYVLSGEVNVTVHNQVFDLKNGGYVYCPPNEKMHLENVYSGTSELFLYKRRYKWVDGYKPYVYSKNIEDIIPQQYEGMEDVLVYDLLPQGLEFDMNFHILSFEAGASHGYIETHVQEHGAYILNGEGVYNLDNHWIPVKKGDYLFMGAYSLQAGYGVGRGEAFSYLYSKDCNRDEEI